MYNAKISRSERSDDPLNALVIHLLKGEKQMEEKVFKDQFVVTFLATYAATIYDESCTTGQHGRLRELPVEDAEGLAEDAWNHRNKILELG